MRCKKKDGCNKDRVFSNMDLVTMLIIGTLAGNGLLWMMVSMADGLSPFIMELYFLLSHCMSSSLGVFLLLMFIRMNGKVICDDDKARG